MGGYGSGRHSGLPATNEVRRVDIRYLRKRGWLYSGASGSLSWSRGGKESGRVAYRIKDRMFTLNYRFCRYGDEWEPMELHVPLLTTPCRYGGQRYYFQCPNQNCRRRCELLYSYDKYFLCRKCCGYLYTSQKGDRLDRLQEAKGKIGARIFDDWDGSDGWRKKKGMHWRTFEREHSRYQSLDAAWNRTFCDIARALTGKGL